MKGRALKVPTLRVRCAGRLAAGAAAIALVTLAAPSALAAPDPTPTGGDCVGLVVDPGATPASTACVPFKAGLSGQDVLTAAGRKLTFDANGFICRIDGYPDKCAGDNTHYWSYYHRAPGAAADKWEYSQKGAADYVVHPGESEGWAYQNGANRMPTAVTYDTLRQQAEATATPAGTAATKAADSAATDDGGGSSTLLVVLVVVVIVLLAVGGTLQRLRSRQR